jgi:hypothetical protein
VITKPRSDPRREAPKNFFPSAWPLDRPMIWGRGVVGMEAGGGGWKWVLSARLCVKFEGVW